MRETRLSGSEGGARFKALSLPLSANLQSGAVSGCALAHVPGEVIFIENHENFPVTPSPQLQQAADERFGEETYYAKVDASLPERSQRRWE